jgi:(1->4)-alpha-D-glucan 1-alpha-D-glucosylmutase
MKFSSVGCTPSSMPSTTTPPCTPVWPGWPMPWHRTVGPTRCPPNSSTGPGVPDVYQGTELWDLSLVDPDNRRPVDYRLRVELLERIDAGWLPDIDDDEGAVKLLVTSRALRLRRDRPELFDGYSPILAAGPAHQHVFAFDRGGAITVATRLPAGLAAAGGWDDTRLGLPDGPWTDVLTGRPVPGGVTVIGPLLDRYPIALLTREV